MTTDFITNTATTDVHRPLSDSVSWHTNEYDSPHFSCVVDSPEVMKDYAQTLAASRSFFDSLPGRESLCILVLSEEGRILDANFPHGDALSTRAESLRPGTVLPSIKELMVQAIQPMATSLYIPELGPTWGGGIIRLQCLEEPTVFLAMLSSDPSVHVSTLHATTVSAHAIKKLCETSYTQDQGDVSDNPAGSSTEPENDVAGHQLTDYEKATSLSSLSAGIAHEIRNPLTTARGFLQLFEQRCDPADKAYLSLTIRELDRIQGLLEEFMDLSRPSTEGEQTLDIRQITDAVHQFLGPEAVLCNVEFIYHVPNHPVSLTVHPSKIKQVLINLLKNALHACADHGRVRLTLHDTTDHIRFVIEDNGCGIRDTNQLFKPFQTTKEGGNGLGLFVSKQIIEAHGGQMRVDSTPDIGTTITIQLPKR